MPPDCAGVIALALDGANAPIVGIEHPHLSWAFFAALLVSQASDDPDFIPYKRCCGVIRRRKNIVWIAIDGNSFPIPNDNIVVDAEVRVNEVFMGTTDQHLASIRKVDLGSPVTLKREGWSCIKGVGSVKVFLEAPATTAFFYGVAPEGIGQLFRIARAKAGRPPMQEGFPVGPFPFDKFSAFLFPLFNIFKESHVRGW